MVKKVLLYVLVSLLITAIPAAATAGVTTGMNDVLTGLNQQEKTAGDTYILLEKGGETYYIEKSPLFTEKKGKKVAVALGGGGARALANVGVLKALEEEGIPVDIVVGTSMGAVVAVLYGSGIPVNRIEELVSGEALPNLLSITFPVKSLFNTKELNAFLEEVAPAERMEQFPISTALLSFDLGRGIKYVHTTGPISETVKGSYAIPFVFPIAVKDDFYLMDAGPVELTPVKTAHIMGADMVISTTAYDQLPYDSYELPFRSLIRYFNIMETLNAEKAIAGYSDVTIRNQVGDYSVMDFHLAEKFIEIGYQATKEKMPLIKETLKAQGISYRFREQNTQYTVTPFLNDLKHNREVLDCTVLEPAIFYGRDHNLFNQTLYKEKINKFQYGLKFRSGKADIFILNRDSSKLALQAKARWKKILPRFDLTALYGVDGDKREAELLLEYFLNDFSAGFGMSSFADKQFIHLGSSYDSEIASYRVSSTLDLYSPLEVHDQESVVPPLLASGRIRFPEFGSWSLEHNSLLANKKAADLVNVPVIYRGAAEDSNFPLQSSLQLSYNYRFPYSREYFQSLQLTGIEQYQFLDYAGGIKSGEDNYAVGTGLAVDLKIFGIRPLHLGGYVSYDFPRRSTQTGLDLNLEF